MFDGVNLELSVKKGSGYYHQTPRPLVLAATLNALVRAHRRLKLLPQTERASRSIPQKVKLEVWHHDAGKCVQCGDSNYLEYDHVIPHSLSGASTTNNLQLLCRRCNLTQRLRPEGRRKTVPWQTEACRGRKPTLRSPSLHFQAESWT